MGNCTPASSESSEFHDSPIEWPGSDARRSLGPKHGPLGSPRPRRGYRRSSTTRSRALNARVSLLLGGAGRARPPCTIRTSGSRRHARQLGRHHIRRDGNASALDVRSSPGGTPPGRVPRTVRPVPSIAGAGRRVHVTSIRMPELPLCRVTPFDCSAVSAETTTAGQFCRGLMDEASIAIASVGRSVRAVCCRTRANDRRG